MMQKDKAGIAQDAVSVVIPGATLYIPFAELVDIAQEVERRIPQPVQKGFGILHGVLGGKARNIIDIVLRLFNTLYIPFAELVDIAQEVERLKKEKKRLEGELARVNGMLLRGKQGHPVPRRP